MTRKIDERVGRVRTRGEDLPDVYGRLVSLELNLRGMQATVRWLREDIEDLIAERQGSQEQSGIPGSGRSLPPVT